MAGDFSAGAGASEKAHDTHNHTPGQANELSVEGTVIHGIVKTEIGRERGKCGGEVTVFLELFLTVTLYYVSVRVMLYFFWKLSYFVYLTMMNYYKQLCFIFVLSF